MGPEEDHGYHSIIINIIIGDDKRSFLKPVKVREDWNEKVN